MALHSVTLPLVRQKVYSSNSSAYTDAYMPSLEPVKPALIRMNRYFRSIGRYGPSPFLIAQYGGVGEITQAFCRYVITNSICRCSPQIIDLLYLCRACAVYGGMYILGPQSKISNFTYTSQGTQDDSKAVSLQIPAHYEPVTSDVLIDGTRTLSGHSTQFKEVDTNAPSQVCCIAILSELPQQLKLAITPQTEKGDDDTSDAENGNEGHVEDTSQDVFLMVFPPGSIEGGSSQAVRALFMGSGTGSCPTGQCKSTNICIENAADRSARKVILYLQAMAEGDSLNPKQTLSPYMKCLLGDTLPLFTTYYATEGTLNPLIFTSAMADASTAKPVTSGSEQGGLAWFEGLDLEARRAQDLIRRGLAANAIPTRDVAAEQD